MQWIYYTKAYYQYLSDKKFGSIQFMAGMPILCHYSLLILLFLIHHLQSVASIPMVISGHALPLVSYLHSSQVGKETNKEQEMQRYFRKVELALKLPSYFCSYRTGQINAH